jgi:cytochrome c peroxidase
MGRKEVPLHGVLTVLGVAIVACESANGAHPARDGGGHAAAEGGEADGAAGPSFTDAEWAALRALSPERLPRPPRDPTNRFADDDAAAIFGQTLFYDPSFSGPLLDTDNDGSPQALGVPGQVGRVACAGCHVPDGGFSDTRSFQRQISLGAGWGRRRAPSLLDVGQARLVMWDGRHDTLYGQILGPLESVVEMNSSRLFFAEQIFRKYRTEYEAIFGALPALDDAAQFPPLTSERTGCRPSDPAAPSPACDGPFHGMPGDGAEYDSMTPANQRAVTLVVVNAGKAIGAFERRLDCGPTPFDDWVHGATPVSVAAQRGAALFVGAAGCVTCHSGAFLTDQQFHDVGLAPTVVQQGFIDSNDLGAASGIAAVMADPLNSLGSFSDGSDERLPSAVTPLMTGAFRTPGLRCVAQRPAFMHTGQLRSLSDVVAFFDRGGDLSGYAGASELHALGLTERDRADLVAFLESVNGPGADDSYRKP